MKYFITRKILGYVARKLDGYKTYLFAAAGLLFGLFGMVGHFYPGSGLPQMSFEHAADLIVFGGMGLGGANKIDKLMGLLRKTDESK